MGRIILVLCLLISSVVSAQPGYTNINARYKWIAGGFDSSLILPRYGGVPSGLRSAWNTDGQLAVDTANNHLYVYSGGAWVRLANYSDVSSYTFNNGLVHNSGFVGLDSNGVNPLTRDVLIDGGGFGFGINNLTTFYSNTLGGQFFSLYDGDVGVNPNFTTEIVSGNTTSTFNVMAGDILSPVGTPKPLQILRKLGSNITSIVSNPTSGNTSVMGINERLAAVGADTILLQSGTSAIIDITDKKISIGSDTLIVPNLPYTLSTTGKKIMLRDTATGDVWNIDPALIGGGGSSYTFPYSVVAPGSAIQLENDTTANPANYFYGRNSAGRRGWYPQSGITGVNLFNSDGTLTGYRTVNGNYNGFEMANISSLSIGIDDNAGMTGGIDISGDNADNNYHIRTIGSVGESGIYGYRSENKLYSVTSGSDSSFVQTDGEKGISIKAFDGSLKIPLLNYTLSTTGKKIMLRDTATGDVWNIDPALLGGMTNPMTTTGDIIYSSSGSTPARRGAGDNGTALAIIGGLPTWVYDTCTQATFSAGARFEADTALFTTSTIYGSFYWAGSDTLIITDLNGVMNGGTSDTLGVQLYYNDTLNVTAGADSLFIIPTPLNSTTMGNIPDADEYIGGVKQIKIPPGRWVWMKSPTVVAGRKPYYLSISLIGYKKRI